MKKRCIYELIYWTADSRSHEVRKTFRSIVGVWHCLERYGIQDFYVLVFELKTSCKEIEFYDLLQEEFNHG